MNARFFDSFEISEGCWRWTGDFYPQGYGCWRVKNHVNEAAHRAVYKWLRGNIPDGSTTDHLCENRWCVNPDHLELVSLGQNTRRGMEMRQWRNQVARFLETGRWETATASNQRRRREAAA